MLNEPQTIKLASKRCSCSKLISTKWCINKLENAILACTELSENPNNFVETLQEIQR